jgi:plasmid stabilization system protein ParE
MPRCRGWHSRRQERADHARYEVPKLKTSDIVPYRMRGETVGVLRVFHTYRRLPQQW